MKVKYLKTKEIVDVNDSYAARLIEQGMAVKAPTEKKPAPLPKPRAEKKG